MLPPVGYDGVTRHKVSGASVRARAEITETCMIEVGAVARRVLERPRADGVHVAIDDFGTGYSSLGCDEGQGFLFAKPLEPEDFEIVLLNGYVNRHRDARDRAFC